MDKREQVLDVVQDLTLETGRMPSILEIASRLGLTKQGVLHYFPNRAALDGAVVTRAVARVDAAMTAAVATGGSPVATYLRFSTPDDADRAAAMVLAAASRQDDSGLPPELERAAARWEALIADEVGDPVQAEVVRLVGDGLFAEALLTGTAPAAERVERLIAHLAAPSRRKG